MSKSGGEKNVQLIWSHGLICNSLWGLCAEEWFSCFEDYRRFTPHTDIPHNNKRARWDVGHFIHKCNWHQYYASRLKYFRVFPLKRHDKNCSFRFLFFLKNAWQKRSKKIDVCQCGFKICQYLLNNLGFKDSDLKQRHYLFPSTSRGWLSFTSYFKKSLQLTIKVILHLLGKLFEIEF